MQFSIIVPTYNRADMLPRLIDSVLMQTLRDFELIVVDDDSTDDTEAVIAGYTDPRVKYFKKENEERSAARNYGARKSSGDFLCFVDSDEELRPSHLQCFDEAIKTHPTVNVFRTQFEYFEQDGSSYKSEFSPAIPDIADIWRTFHPVASYCLHRKVWNEIKWPEHFWIWEDKHYFLRVVMNYEIAELPCVTSIFYDHESRSVHVVDNRFADKIWQIEHSVLDLWNTHYDQLAAAIPEREMKDWIHDQLRGIAYDAIAAEEPKLAKKALAAARRYVRLGTVPHWVYARMKAGM